MTHPENNGPLAKVFYATHLPSHSLRFGDYSGGQCQGSPQRKKRLKSLFSKVSARLLPCGLWLLMQEVNSLVSPQLNVVAFHRRKNYPPIYANLRELVLVSRKFA